MAPVVSTELVNGSELIGVAFAKSSFAGGGIIFAFPRDFTKNDERNFRTKLVDPYPQLEVLPWPLSEIIDRLDRHSDLKKRYFGRDREDVLDSVLRAVEQGGRLQTGEDLIARTRALAEFADQHDRDFEYDIRFWRTDIA